MVPLGTQLPAFSLPDGNGVEHSADACRGKAGTLVIFMCNHCPFVVHLREALAEFGREYQARGVAMVAIWVGFTLLGELGWGGWGAGLSPASGIFLLLLAPDFFQPLWLQVSLNASKKFPTSSLTHF